MERLIGILGVLVMLALAWAMSSARRRVPWRIVITGITLQVALAAVLLSVPPVVAAFNALAVMINEAIGATAAGIEFVFRPVAGVGTPEESFVFAIHAMSVVIFFASLMAILYHIGLMQRVVAALAWVLRTTLGVTGAEALAMAANIFVGQTEAPLCVKPYIERMSRSQLMTLMVGGFATIAGSVLAAYVGMLGGESDADRTLFIRHLLTASLMSAPAAFVIAKLIIPETESPATEGVVLAARSPHVNLLDAAAAGASEGAKLAINIIAMLIAFVSLVALVNLPLGWAGGLIDARLGGETAWAGLSIEMILGWVFRPLAWTLGVPWEDCPEVGTLLGEKLVLTEFIAYVHLADMANAESPEISRRSSQIAAYALCGFANFASIAIQIGGLSTIAPGKRSDFVRLAPRAMVGGALASWMTASIASLFIAP